MSSYVYYDTLLLEATFKQRDSFFQSHNQNNIVLNKSKLCNIMFVH
jgi:hypothetical protein